MPRSYVWLMGLALLVLGLALTVGGGEESVWLLVLGIVPLGLGVLVTLRAWRSSGWRYRRVGILVAIVGALFVATSFDGDCDCSKGIYFGAALTVIGAVAQFGERPLL